MFSIAGLTFFTLILAVVEVQSQACPEGANVAKMCVPGTYTGERVLIDTSSYDPAVGNCSCTFGTNSSVMKLVTYVAPNYPECNSAIRLYSSSGNSIRFQCLMSGTYLDTSQYNAGVATFETYSNLYDKNYCLVLEIAGRIDDRVTVSCTADIPEESTTLSVLNNKIENNDVMTDNVNTDAVVNHSATFNGISSSNKDRRTTTDPTTHQETKVADLIFTTTTTATTTATEPSTVRESILEFAAESFKGSTIADVPKSTENIPKDTTTGVILTDTTLRVSNAKTEITDMAYEATTAGAISKNRATSTVESVVTEAKPNNTSTRMLPQEAGFEIPNADLPLHLLDDSKIIVNASVDNATSANESNISHNFDIVFTSSVDNNMNAMNVTTLNNDNEQLLYTDTLLNTSDTERKPKNDLTTLVTGTVLFNRGGAGLSKTIQSIGSVQADVFNDKLINQENTTTVTPETATTKSSLQSFKSNEISNSPISNTISLLNPENVRTAIPTDISNLFDIGVDPRNSIISSNASNDSNYSLSFPVFDPVMVEANQSTENITDEFGTLSTYNTHNENDTLFLNTNYNINSFITDENIISNETHTDINYTAKVETSTFRSNTALDNLFSTEVTNKALRTSPYTTNEARLIMESSEPIDIVANMPMKIPQQTENTTLPMSNDLNIQYFNRTVNKNEQESVNSVVNVTSKEVYPTQFPGFRFAVTDQSNDNHTQTWLQEVSQQEMQNPYTNLEKNVNSLMKSLTDANFENQTTDSNYSMNEELYGSLDPFSNQLTVSSMTKEELNQNTTFNDTDAPMIDTFAVSQNSSSSGLENELSKVVFEKGNNYESSSNFMAEGNVIEDISNIVTYNDTYKTAHDASLKEYSNETMLIDNDSNVTLQAFHVQSDKPTYEINATEMRSSFDPADTYVQNKIADQLSISNNHNGTPEPYTNGTSLNLDQEAFFNELPVDRSSKYTMVGDGIEMSTLSTDYSISDQNHTHATDTILDFANESIENFTNSHVEDVHSLSNVLNQTTEIINQRPFVSDATTVSYGIKSSGSASILRENEISPMKIFPRISESVSEINITELQPTNTSDVITPETDNMTFTYNAETASKREHLPEKNVTETLSNVVEQDPYWGGDSPLSYSLDVQSNETTRVANEPLNNSVAQISVKETAPTLMPDVVDENFDNLTFFQPVGETLSNNKHVTEVNFTHTTLPTAAEQESFSHGLTTNSNLFNFLASIAPPVEIDRDINQLTFVDNITESTSEINVRENTLMLDVMTEKFDTLSTGEHLREINFRQSLHDSVEQVPILSESTTTTRTYSFDTQSSETTPILTDRKVSHLSFVNHLSEPFANDIARRESTPETVTKNVNGSNFDSHMNTHLLDAAHHETSTVKNFVISSSSSNSQVSVLSDQKTVTDRTINEYVVDNSIDQHNLLSATEASPFDIVQENVKTTSKESSFSDADYIPTTTYSFRNEIEIQRVEKVNGRTTNGPSSTSIISNLVNLTTDQSINSLIERQTTTETDNPSGIVEDMIVADSIKTLHARDPMKEDNVQHSSNSVVPPDVLADIEKQIIFETKESTSSVLKTLSTTEHKTEVSTAPSIPELAAHNTHDRNVTINENIPASIIPKVLSDIQTDIPITPKQNMNIVEEEVLVENPTRTMADKAGDSGLNVYFDTGRSKSSAFDMNNDTYIIVVGAIVGLVVIAVVIGIFCHNGRKRRSEKVNISGNNSEAPSHQNQAFDIEAMNDIPSGTTTQNGEASPEVNGTASTSANSQDVHNGNVDLS